jgi:hypothetical protein
MVSCLYVPEKICCMKKILALLFACTAWFALIAQFYIMMENRLFPVPETVIRFFSYFTILTNMLVAVYFTLLSLVKKERVGLIHQPGTLTAITIYITMVGTIYQVALRHVWEPQGLQRLVDELLHSVIPVLVIIFWSLYEMTKPVKYTDIFKWTIYPLVYLVFILVRGRGSSFYPYPFVDVTTLGMQKVLINSGVILLAFLVVAAIFLFIGKKLLKRQTGTL